MVVSNNRIVLSNHTKLLAGAVRARLAQGSKSSKVARAGKLPEVAQFSKSCSKPQSC